MPLNSALRLILAGRTISVTDAAGAITSTAYDVVHDQPAVVTDAMGNTACYKYDARGRKIAEWGTALQPACFGYDEMDNLTTLRTFRADNEVITTDPSERTDGDVTTWASNPVTGLEISKTYADNTSVVKTYDAYNRLATETDTRGNVKTYAYEHARGLHLSTIYTVVDGTAQTSARSCTYNHLGQMTQLVDDAGTRSFAYNTYGERESDSLVVDGDTHLITEQRDSFGRSTGFAYSKNGTVLHTVTTGYGTDGRISSAGFTHGGAVKQFGYEYLNGTNLLHKLTKPNNMTLTQTYEATRNLLTGMAYHRGTTLIAQRTYSYDILGRPTARNTARNGQTMNDTFAHNNRSELVGATVNSKEYEYAYDNIGNRQQATEGNDVTVYDANALNQYTAISENGASAFVPQFDADGNQTLIKTDAGIWSAVYNAENRPVTFTNSDSNTVVECAYDSQGRRSYKKVTVNGSVTLHQRYIYRGYLQIACIDLTRSNQPALWFITWDPTQPVATRPLAIRKDGSWFTYGWDLTKNICEIFGPAGYPRTTYTYSPFGQATASGDVTQPIQWSSEVWDSELGLVYYNWRHYNAMVGRWIAKDRKPCLNLYIISNNTPTSNIDLLGLEYINNYNLVPLAYIIKSRGVFAYTGTTVSDEILKELREPTDDEKTAFENANKETKIKINDNIRNRYIPARLGIKEKTKIIYRNGCAFAPKIDVVTETLIPSDLKMTHRGHIMLFFHELNRSIVYENIYNNYIKPIESLRCNFRYSKKNMDKFKQYYTNSLNKALTTAWIYAQTQLGDTKYAIGIDKDNSYAIFEDENNKERTLEDFTNAYFLDQGVKEKWTFHGFKKAYDVIPPSKFIPPPCPKFN